MRNSCNRCKTRNQISNRSWFEIGETRGILVNEFIQTSNPDIYAVGDAIEVAHYINNKKC